MPISEVASLVGGAALGAPFSEVFKALIKEVRKVNDFKPLFHDLASTMERLTPVVNQIESMQEESNPGNSELKILIKTMQRAEEMVRKCSRVQWNIGKRAMYSREIKAINQAFLNFCQVELQLIQNRNLLQCMRTMASVSLTIDLPSDTGTELFLVPQPEEVTISWLDRPLRELKEMLFEDGVVTVVVSAPYACGKTLLVTKLCHDADVKGKFKQVLFISVSKGPNIRLIVQRLLQHTGCIANESANNFDTRLSIQQLLQHLGQRGSILLVLDDVWPEEESLLEQFLIRLTDYKILVTSRFEFSSFGPTFRLEDLIGEDFKNLFIECTPQPNCLSCARRDHLFQKIFKRCNGLPLAMNPPCSICEGCNIVIENGRPVNVLGVLWHPECFCCDVCHKPITIQEVEKHVSNSRGKFHKSCYRRYYRVDCTVCKEKIPPTGWVITYNEHPFWKEKYCPSHEVDGTPKCCSCERLVPRGENYALFGDGRWLCLECMESSVMDTYEAQPLHLEIREFFEGLNMKIQKEFPFLLVEYQALNKAVEEEKIDHHPEVVTRALCLNEELIISSVSKRPRMGPNGQLVDLITESQRLFRDCEVTGILIIYGLPRLLTGYMLAHEMMHAYLSLNGYRSLDKVLEEGICQVLGYMWLESQTYGTSDAAAGSSKKGDDRSDFEKKLLEFCMYQIKEDDSPVYGLGFKKVNEMMVSNHYNLKDTLKDIVRDSNI